jgi:hypothetical protein
MKNYSSQEEGVWKEILNPTITEQQLVILEGEDNAEKQALIQSIKLSSVQDVVNVTELVALYNTHKPVLKEADAYVFIDMHVSNNKGLLNCRVNGEHKQIRF